MRRWTLLLLVPYTILHCNCVVTTLASTVTTTVAEETEEAATTTASSEEPASSTENTSAPETTTSTVTEEEETLATTTEKSVDEEEESEDDEVLDLDSSSDNVESESAEVDGETTEQQPIVEDVEEEESDADDDASSFTDESTVQEEVEDTDTIGETTETTTTTSTQPTSSTETEEGETNTASSDDTTTAASSTTEASDGSADVDASGPFVDLFGPSLMSLEMIDEKSAQLKTHATNDALQGKKVIGLYFSADWCGPCRQFTPELVAFYDKMNSRRGKEGQFELVWVSRSRDYDKWGQFFAHMKWYAMSPELAMGQKGALLSEKYKVKGIPSLVLLDEMGNVITSDARNKIPADRAGVGFPWRNPLVSAYITLVPRRVRFMIKDNLLQMKHKVLMTAKGALGIKQQAATA